MQRYAPESAAHWQIKIRLIEQEEEFNVRE